MLKFSILNAFRRKGIAIIAIIGNALGVALMTVLLSISGGMDVEMTSAMNADVFHGFLWIVSLVAAVAGGFYIFIVMLISVIERTGEFGILKASGWSDFNIVGSVVGQSITVGLLGTAAGLLIGYGALQAINSYLTIDIGIITWRLVLIIVGFGVAMGIIGGLYPSLRAARISPMESLRAI